ncbi:PASTA domain-containing protein [Bernardetia sp.]|uniref:PASTA domain-containing protein n=1 Tax=Bernardetia sp. TaxID=1937974 RepID=UPI0025BD65FB|nr:PASTA domain-containing protein [Bernardetia sp.]
MDTNFFKNLKENINFKEVKHKTHYYLTRNHYSTLFIHLVLMGLLVAIILYAFFYMYLPNTTNHDVTIRVPDLNKMKIEEVENFLEKRDLRYEIADTSYNPDYPPLTVLQQNPTNNSLVKINRKIYLTINSATPPKTRIPQIIDFPYTSATTQIENVKLKVGKKEFVKNSAKNVVLKIAVDGTEYEKADLEKGVYIPQGTPITLFIAEGNNNDSFEFGNYIGQYGEDAKLLIEGSRLDVEVYYKKVEGKEVGTVISQKPAAGTKVIVGQKVQIWIASAYE